MGTVKSYFAARGYTNTHSVPFYNGDYNCSGDRLNKYDGRCAGWYANASVDGTVNEDIRHRSCVLAWQIWDYYTQYGTYIAVVAHSEGGILIRQAMNDAAYVHPTFPPYLKISDVVTAGTPHQGLGAGTAWAAQQAGWIGQPACPSPCLEISQMERPNPLMSNLNSQSFRGGFARNPQGSGGTDWTTISSNADSVLVWWCITNSETMGAPWDVSEGAACGLMPGAKHFVDYPATPSPNYDHGDYLTDTNTAWNATEIYSDDNGHTWFYVDTSNHSIFTMHYGVLYSTW